MNALQQLINAAVERIIDVPETDPPVHKLKSVLGHEPWMEISAAGEDLSLATFIGNALEPKIGVLLYNPYQSLVELLIYEHWVAIMTSTDTVEIPGGLPDMPEHVATHLLKVVDDQIKILRERQAGMVLGVHLPHLCIRPCLEMTGPLSGHNPERTYGESKCAQFNVRSLQFKYHIVMAQKRQQPRPATAVTYVPGSLFAVP